MKFLYEYRTPDNEKHKGEIKAADREAAYALLKKEGIKPCRFSEAPGLFNKVFGKGKRWIAIAVLAVVAAVAIAYAGAARREAKGSVRVDAETRRQVWGDQAVIEKGIRTGWAEVFAENGDRFLASFAIPGVPAGVRTAREDEVRRCLDTELVALDSDSMEIRQIKGMLEGVKREARAFLRAGGTVQQYAKRLVDRQEQEISIREKVENELRAFASSGATPEEVEALWERRNDELRKMGIRLVSMPETGGKEN